MNNYGRTLRDLFRVIELGRSGRIQGVAGQDPGCSRAGSRVEPAGSRVRLGRIQGAAGQDPWCAGLLYTAFTLHNLTFNTLKDQEHL